MRGGTKNLNSDKEYLAYLVKCKCGNEDWEKAEGEDMVSKAESIVKNYI